MTEEQAALHLEEELARIDERFEAGELKAFGRGQDKLLADFEEIRKMQAQLAARHIRKRPVSDKGRAGEAEFLDKDDVAKALKARDEALRELSGALSTVCNAIDETNQSVRRETKGR
eukprot:m51a1_g612 hypothetical protein (117) ;mRNA; f:93252-93717